MKKKQIRFIHILPLDCVGGVECAAKTSENISSENFLFSLFYISGKIKNKKLKFLNFLSYVRDSIIAIFRINECSPDFLIISLWKSCIVAIFIKFLNPKVKLILFLHSSNLNFIDYFFNNIVGIISFEIWADSEITLVNRMNSFLFINEKLTKKTISFVLNQSCPFKFKSLNSNFIFWGRLHPIKNIKKSIEIFYSIYKQRNNSEFIIIGSDEGDYLNLKKQIIKLKLENNVRLYSEMTFENIRKIAHDASFFIQSSLSEGMAMSVVEAMQLGLVPIVTNVGNIQNYCEEDFNSIIIDKGITRKILNTLNDKNKYLFLRKNAIITWDSKPLYREDIYENCLRLSGKLRK